MDLHKIIFFLALGITLCYAKIDGTQDVNSVVSEKSVNVSAPAEKTSNIVAQPLSNDFGWKTSLGQALAYVGVAAFSFVLIGGLTLLLGSWKLCYLFNNCEPVTTPYTSGGNLQNPGQANSYSNDMYYYPSAYSGYTKRSLDYIKPIIEHLASTYEKQSK